MRRHHIRRWLIRKGSGMRYMALNIEGRFAAVLDTQAKEVLIYDPRFTGEAPRGARQQDQWTADGKFITSILTGMVVQHGDNPWSAVGYADPWMMNAGDYVLVTPASGVTLTNVDFQLIDPATEATVAGSSSTTPPYVFAWADGQDETTVFKLVVTIAQSTGCTEEQTY